MTAYQGCASQIVDKSAGSRFPVSRGCAPLPDWRTVRATGFAAQNMLILSACFRSSLRVEVSNSDFMLWVLRCLEVAEISRRWRHTAGSTKTGQSVDLIIPSFIEASLSSLLEELPGAGAWASASLCHGHPWPSLAIRGLGVAGVSWRQTRNRPGWDGDYLSADETCAAGSLKGCLDVGALCGGWNYPQPQPWTFGVGRKSTCRQARW